MVSGKCADLYVREMSLGKRLILEQVSAKDKRSCVHLARFAGTKVSLVLFNPDDSSDESQTGITHFSGNLPTPFGGKNDFRSLKSGIAIAVGNVRPQRRRRRVEALALDSQFPAHSSHPRELHVPRTVRLNRTRPTRTKYNYSIRPGCRPQSSVPVITV